MVSKENAFGFLRQFVGRNEVETQTTGTGKIDLHSDKNNHGKSIQTHRKSGNPK